MDADITSTDFSPSHTLHTCGGCGPHILKGYEQSEMLRYGQHTFICTLCLFVVNRLSLLLCTRFYF